MSLVAIATSMIERTPLPDLVTSAGISLLVDRSRRRLARGGDADAAVFARRMAERPIAVSTDAANAQHYELPVGFFDLVLGPRRKYSCCLYRDTADSLTQAEDGALQDTALHADLADGQDILELGCGWGSLSLWMAERFPTARITAVSNSTSQRHLIEAEAAARGFRNLQVVTADMNVFGTRSGDEHYLARFDRVVSVEMFEHMSNWKSLLRRVHEWLQPDGRLFLHVFTHRSAAYLFDVADPDDWIAQHFFTGGIMPSHGLLRHVAEQFEIEEEWRWSGTHYARTALDWLANFDRNQIAVAAVLNAVYGADAALWKRRWRLFFLATAGLFGHAEGSEWGVSHYRLRRSTG